MAFLAAGAIGIFVFRGDGRRPTNTATGTSPPSGTTVLRGFGVLGAFSISPTSQLFVFFFKTGLLVFGSGLVIVPFLKAYVVDQYHWLSNRQFLDSVAIGMISPGPVVITATFVGYLLQGFKGALAATCGIFAPSVIFTVITTPLMRRHRESSHLQGFLRGITSAVVGALVGTTVLVGQSAIGDILTACMGMTSLAVVLLWKRIPEPVLVLLAGVVGLLTYPWLAPSWLLR